MRKTRYSYAQRVELNKWFARSHDVLDASHESSYEHDEDHHTTGSTGSKTGLIVGIVVGLSLGVLILVLLYIRRRSIPYVRNWRFPWLSQPDDKDILTRRNTRNANQKFLWKHDDLESRSSTSMEYQTVLTRPIASPRVTENPWPRLKRLSRRRSRGVQEIIGTSKRPFATQPEQSPSSVPSFPLKTETSQSIITNDNEISTDYTNNQTELPRKKQFPESSWLILSPSKSDDQTNIETISRPETARTSRVTIPSYYYQYYRKYFDRDNYRVQSQQYPESRFSTSRDSDMISFGRPSMVLSSYQKRGTFSTIRPASSVTSKTLSQNYKDPLTPMSADPNFAYFEFDVHVLQKPKQVVVPARRNKSMDTNDESIIQRDKKNGHAPAASIATVSTAPIFRQHPGDEVDLESAARVGRVRSSLLNGLIVHRN
ncbi:hypothetical protein TSTA_043270 [Talaromyces stipitatus ATCC 10500]|uniref:Uncharacterized protein n=1 Tax=Talaromyces stipitatus (strain ATCC 10500 / CBS 375.48 / QM 6759 / NRRL 1006) TaxID=441959 RepID=B8MK35_TALSN|nr:uncharacterized protein TSTA_043270 [Talaromyces stipitatus ATCC 10500]EED14852.1 hypothetical protein TSTA_043270 [Talaromyces stipitatus ATCC 10500]